ncbi:MAG: hypothetical protein E7L01_26705 [Paenibacillus macerans]|uniref:Uncharacterized protein n=1 Tax=Paenibacillus macerans TaxID=44252 RepID=A0A6N8ES29_PAEMA|nr:hypothetical protein [Paenibacillus macerans]MDU7476904.1 hypothetical protein [Paenibacillus macerans]MUG22344.1 hypothetical protein [Paenibacillus macerans]UMV49108.1 hypothetical protein LMZ02_07045 [Paenibacillus macerans]
MAREYASEVTVSLSQIRDIVRAQRLVIDKGIIKPSNNDLMSGLGAVATILGLIFVQSTPVGVVAGVVGVLSLMAPSEEEAFKGLLEAGYSELANLEYFLVDNPKYDLIRVKLPFLEYTVDGERIRFVTGKGVVTALHIKGGNWIPM